MESGKMAPSMAKGYKTNADVTFMMASGNMAKEK